MRPTVLARCLFLVAIAAPVAVATRPQATGTIAGVVKSADGSPIGGVTVSISNGGWFKEIFSGTGGIFRVSDLEAGSYSVWCSLPGFSTFARQHVIVAAAHEVTLNATLQAAPVVSSITVVADDPSPSPLVFASEVAVRLNTGVGNIVIAVDATRAPITVANFLKYVDSGFYDRGRFHRATRAESYTPNLPNRPLLEVIQAGINPARRSKSLPPIPLERTSITGLKHTIGTVSMARGAPDSATSDFFILLNDQPSLDFGGKRFDDEQGAAAFGRVVWGMDVVRKIQQQPTSGQRLNPPITIVSAKRVQP